MRYDHNDSAVVAALGVVRQYDPETYARMQAAEWHVSTDPLSELFMPEFSYGMIADGPSMFLNDGTTLPREAGDVGNPYGMTWLNSWGVGMSAARSGVSATFYMAAVLVHEFRHVYTKGHNEPEAFKAGSAFAALLPSPDGEIIKRDSDEILAAALAHPEIYPNTLSD